MEGSWEGIAGCVVHVAVHGECVCCGWMECSCSRRDEDCRIAVEMSALF